MDPTESSSKRFGYLHGRVTVQPQTMAIPYHLAVMYTAVGAPPLTGRVLDAGCGDGVDLASNGLRPDCTPVGLELSDGGIRTSAARLDGHSRARLVQGDLRRLPFQPYAFDGAYSYGVIHHTADPAGVMKEIARVLKPGAPFIFYVYEDLSDRSLPWRAGLGVVSAVRRLTIRLPPRLLMALCHCAAPAIYVTCVWPSRRFRWAARMPYRHCRSVRGIVPDLYDRMAAPLEYRYSRSGAARLATAAGLSAMRVARERGWVVWAKKPVDDL
jgi:SAM-dependent methyltransferase